MIEEDNIDTGSAKRFLSEVSMFEKLNSDVLQDMADRMSLFRFEKGEHLIEKNKPGRYMLLITQGKVCVPLGDNNIYLTQGTVVGEMSLMSGQLSKADVIAETETSAYSLNRYDFQNLMSKHEGLSTTMKALVESRSS